MSERTALQCTNCDYLGIVHTPDTQEGLVNCIVELKNNHPCANMNLLQITWITEHGAFGHRC